MPPLPTAERRNLETAVVKAREAAETAGRRALDTLAVEREEPFASLGEAERALRRALRARARQLGDGVFADGVPLLVEQIAYEQWHRMLFARFLAENGLLRHPSGPTVSLRDCAELAEEEGGGDAWELAARYAGAMLPGLFRQNDPAVRVRFAPEGRSVLEGILAALPASTFVADDALGWVYQFWQTRKKKEVNASGRKIGGADLAPVTQLFTEDYMVRFLLENSLGAWWAARHPDSPLLADWPYLRFLDAEISGAGNGADGRAVGASVGPAVGGPGVETPGSGPEAPPGLNDGVSSPGGASSLQPGVSTPGTPNPGAPPPTPYPGHATTGTPNPGGAPSLTPTLGADPLTPTPDAPPLTPTTGHATTGGRRPAAGAFPSWPDRAAAVTVMDPCCGSGHFLVAAFGMLRRMRMEEEGLGEADAADAVLRDNLFGLELDPRCTQIAAFAVALAAWKAGGHPERFPPRIACSGVPVAGQLDEWRRLAKGDANLRDTLEHLHALFADAPTLGSLIDPRRLVQQQGMFAPRWAEVERALARLAPGDEEHAIFAQAAAETARAAVLLGRTYTLVATNVPYLTWGSQANRLKAYSARFHDDAKTDLATVFVDRCLRFCDTDGTSVLVTPQNWLFLGTYRAFRRRILETARWNTLARLGSGAFETVTGEVVNVVLGVITNSAPPLNNEFVGMDVGAGDSPAKKDWLIRIAPTLELNQLDQLANPDQRVTLTPLDRSFLLEQHASGLQGISSADIPRFGRCFWEIRLPSSEWSFQQSTVPRTMPFGGREHLLHWEKGEGVLARFPPAAIRGRGSWGKSGVAISQMMSLPATLYTGELFDDNTAVVLPYDPQHLSAIWAFCSSPEYTAQVRRIDQKMRVTNATLVKVPFDLDRWQQVAAERYPDGLPEPHSADPTQWLFAGHPVGSDAPLPVAVARLLGYRWPQQAEDDQDLARFANRDGIVCLPPVGGEQPAADRLRSLLAAAYGADWSPGRLDGLLAEVGFGGKDLAAWLRDGFFAQHCKLFHNRPFVWHVWDGRKDGFSALVNYHRLDGRTLEKLTYSSLGAWIAAQRAARDAGEAGAEGRLLAAQDLQRRLIAIREGEPPYDVFVRWKPLPAQPLGWVPDLNDGVRLNVRPWVTAGVLRSKFTVKWTKDRGTNPDGSERRNDRHPTLAEKRRARDDAAAADGAGT